ncbi:hypothetical protein ACWDR3_24900 [Streptomyces sp. NPDC001002]
MQSQAVTIAAIIATALVVIVRDAFNCYTRNQAIKAPLKDSDSAHRARILGQIAIVLKHLPKDHWGRK